MEAVCLVGMATVAEGERAVVAALAKVAAEAEAMVAMVVTTAAVVTSFART